jgi:UDP-N-acetylglucosamine 2-epimerase
VKLLCIAGTRPQLIKAAAAWPALREAHQPALVDTGQHYDDELASSFFEELHLPRPDHQLGVGSGTHGRQLAAMVDRLEPIMLDGDFDAAVVFGDTNSTLAGALTAVKLDLPTAHVEAGLRSFDRHMPEEINRVVVDHLCGLLLAPNAAAAANLRAEGIGSAPLGAREGPLGRQRIDVVGDLMQDLCAQTVPEIRSVATIGEAAPEPVAALGLRPGEYLLATVHRAENRRPEALAAWTRLLVDLGRPVVLPLHPGTRHVLDEFGFVLGSEVHVLPPLGYRTTLALQLHAAAVVTDSGGVQREAAWLGVPALILRDSTEWPETLESNGGRSVLVGRDGSEALRTLERLAPAERSPRVAAERAATAEVAPAGAAQAISRAIGEWLTA